MHHRWRLVLIPVVLSAATGCAVPYKAFGGREPYEVGYSIEELEGGKYTISYSGGESSDFSRIEVLLLRYADEICLAEPTLGPIERSTFVPEVWTGARKPGNTIDVSASMECTEIDKSLFSQASSSRL